MYHKEIHQNSQHLHDSDVYACSTSYRYNNQSHQNRESRHFWSRSTFAVNNKTAKYHNKFHKKSPSRGRKSRQYGKHIHERSRRMNSQPEWIKKCEKLGISKEMYFANMNNIMYEIYYYVGQWRSSHEPGAQEKAWIEEYNKLHDEYYTHGEDVTSKVQLLINVLKDDAIHM